jgi:hypothetical protein
MATILIERPHVYSFSMNEIRYMFHVSDPASAGCVVEVELYYREINSSVNTLLKRFALTPPGDGIIYCHVADFLDSIVSAELPNLNGPRVQPIRDQVKYFYIRYRQLTTAAPTADWQTDDARIVMLGGVEQIKFTRNNFFASYLPANKPFFTWQPSNRFVHPDEKQWLTFLLVTPADFVIKITTVFTDASTSIFTIPVSPANDILFRIKTGATELGLTSMQPSKQIHYYEIQVLKEDELTVLAASYRYYIEYRPLYSFYDIAFFGSLGGLETVRVKGTVDWSIETNSDDIEHVIYKDAVNTQKPQCQFSQTNTTKRDNFKGDAGWCRNKNEQESLVELTMSKGRYQIIDGRWIGLVNLKKNLDLRTSIDKTWSFPIEWSYGYSEKTFTPKWVALGPGVGDNVCASLPIPQGLQIVPLELGADGIYKYQAQWTYNRPYVFGIIELTTSIDGGATWQPVAAASYNFNSQQPKDHLFRVIVRCPLDLTVFTTANIGYSWNAPPCVPVTLPVVTLPDARVNIAYSETIALTGSAPFTLSDVVKPDWMTIAVNGSNVNFTGTPTAQAQNVTISFKVNNCSGSSADFTDAIDVLESPSLIQISNTLNGSTRTQSFQVGNAISPGLIYWVMVYSHEVSITSVLGDTPTSIAAKLRDAVNATTLLEWKDHNSNYGNFKPSATVSGSVLILLINGGNQFASGVR